MHTLQKVYDIISGLEDLESENSSLTWVQYTTGFDFGIEDNERRMQEYCEDKERFETIRKNLSLVWNEEDRRRVELAFKRFEPYHLSDELNALSLLINKKTNELSKILNTHRAIFEGHPITSAEITQILYNEEDRERRKAAFLSRCSVNKALVDGGFLELIQLRNQYAKLAGNSDFVEYKLEQDELDGSLFHSWKEDLSTLLPRINEKRRQFAQTYLNDDKIMPWDEFYINGKIAPVLNTVVDLSQFQTVISRFVGKFGFDLSSYNIVYDVFPRAQKSEWGYHFTIRNGVDSRILANVKNRYNEYNVLMHETGHGIHSFNTNPEDKLMNLGISGIISEGIANLFGGFIYDRAFFEELLPDPDEAVRQFSALREYKSLTAMLSIHNILFDQSLYRTTLSSLEDINQLYFDLSRELYGEEPYANEPAWGFRIHYTTHPIYLHNYFMGDVTCEMLERVFRLQYGAGILEKPKEFGNFLIDTVIRPSGRYQYQELYQKISGEAFSLKALLK